MFAPEWFAVYWDNCDIHEECQAILGKLFRPLFFLGSWTQSQLSTVCISFGMRNYCRRCGEKREAGRKEHQVYNRNPIQNVLMKVKVQPSPALTKSCYRSIVPNSGPGDSVCGKFGRFGQHGLQSRVDALPFLLHLCQRCQRECHRLKSPWG